MVSAPALAAPTPLNSVPAGVTTVTDSLDERRWNAFVLAHRDGTVEHLWAWQHVFRDVFRQRPLYLAAQRNNEVTGVLPLVRFRSLLFGRAMVALPYANYAGLLADDDDAVRSLMGHAMELARQDGASHVELRHVSRQLPELPVREHKVGSRLEMPASTDALWSALDRKVRNQIRKAQKSELAVARGGPELVDDFYRVFSRNMRDLGTPVFPRELFHAALRIPEHGQVFVVRNGETPIAAAISLRWRDTVLVPWASSLREYRHLCANMLLYWGMLEDAVSYGVRVFDFGRSSAGGSTHQFKQQWGASDVPLHWEYAMLAEKGPTDQGTSNPRMQMVIKAWQHLPLWLANALGPRVVRHVP